MNNEYTTRQALNHYNTHVNEHRDDLLSLVRIPSISFPGFDPAPVRASAGSVSKLLKRSGLTDVQFLEPEGGHPSVFGQWVGAPGRPTVLLYAHHDVQPTGSEDLWKSPPFEPSLRDGRLYGRGVTDDKGGIVMYTAAIRSYLDGPGALPVNVKVLIEGEEEVGSSNLPSLLTRYRDLLQADVVVIADSENFDSGFPSLTVSLRGIVTVTVEVRSLSSSVHSGTWGGPLPDPVQALAKMLATLVDDKGQPAIPGLMDGVRPLTREEQTALEGLPYNESVYRSQAKLGSGAQIIGGPGSVYEKMWFRPSISVNAIEASSRKQAANIINATAWARVGIRIVPDMDPDETLRLLTEHLRQRIPWGVDVQIEPETPSPWWHAEQTSPAFEAAAAALEKGYGKAPAIVGGGGSIPFVRTITDAFGGAPALLLGVGDPYSSAHSENESLLVSDWEKACRSVIYLFDELALRLT
ncbi:MAG: dipeptidase [Nitrospirae bacterium GWC1_57_7]|nr:MAG: dipeptidase [Nitrospirae bacterium GWC1_57_7]HAR44587.1 dipeptidase [Nitrospiraceae bacterium]